MKYRALYRETRPEVFSEVLGQDHIVKILRHQIRTDSVSHAYLFTGTRGTGKTTTARILAKAVNCLAEDAADRPCGECANCRAIAAGKFLDVIEIDAASNNGVDNIRELRESVNYPPAAGRKKVYIIDEVHMLTPGAYNALLKTLEEPPEDVMFILATTDPERLSQTVRSRCMRLDFRRVPADILADHMKEIAEARGVRMADSALRLLASNADGSVRDSLSLLEQCLSAGQTEISREDVINLLGTVSGEFFLELTEKVMARNVSQAFLLLDRAIREGKDVRQIMRDWMAHLRAVMIVKYVQSPEEILNLSADSIRALREQGLRISVEELESAIVTIAKAINDARYSTQARILMEVAIVTIASGQEYGRAPQAPAPAPQARPDLRPPERPQAPPRAAEAARGGAGQSGAPGARAAQDAPGTPEIQAAPEEAPARRSGRGAAEAPAERREAAAEPPQAAEGPGPAADAEALQELWDEVFETLEAGNPKLNAMRRTVLAEVGALQYKVLVTSPLEKRILESEREMIDAEVSRRLGRSVAMECRLTAGEQGAEADQELREEAAQASKLLGVQVRIVD